MRIRTRSTIIALLGLTAGTASAQMNLSGYWRQVGQQDSRDNPHIGELVGLPLGAEAIHRAETYDQSILSIPEWQCRPHSAAYVKRDRTYFNGEGIRLVHKPNAHTNGDTIVYFRNSDVVATGDLFSTESFPVIDIDAGGHIDGIIDALNDMIDLSIPEFRTEGGTMFVPGHGRLADSADVTYYRDMLTIVRDRIRHLMDQGLSLKEVQAADPTFGYHAQWGSDSGFWTTEMFVEAVYRNLDGGS